MDMRNKNQMEMSQGKPPRGKFAKALRVIAILAASWGAFRLFASRMVKRGKRLERESRNNPDKRYFGFTSGSSLKFKGEKVRSIDLTSIMGGFELDLTGAKLAKETRIHVRCVMAGLDIKVSPMVEVRDDSHCVMGGVANMVPRYNREDLPIIHVDAECLMSGIAIKVVCEPEA